MKNDLVEGRCSTTSEQNTQPSVDGLIAQLEAVTEGSAELDARLQAWEYGEILDKLDDGPRGGAHPYDPLSVCWIAASNGRRYTCWANKAYTRSLDAAMTLLPEICQWTIEIDACWLRFPGKNGNIESVEHVFYGRGGKCTALAICCCALDFSRYSPQTVLGTPGEAQNTDSSPKTTTPDDGGREHDG